jgi:hypothetical protein
MAMNAIDGLNEWIKKVGGSVSASEGNAFVDGWQACEREIKNEADVVERHICNAEVADSIPVVGSSIQLNENLPVETLAEFLVGGKKCLNCGKDIETCSSGCNLGGWLHVKGGHFCVKNGNRDGSKATPVDDDTEAGAR